MQAELWKMDDYENEYDETMSRHMSSYVKGLVKFTNIKGEWIKILPSIQQLTYSKRAEWVLKNVDELYWDLNDRPRGMKWSTICGINELDAFCDALCIGWKLWPDMWMGLQMVLDVLTEQTPNDIVKKINKPTLTIIKEIAVNKRWPNNPMGSMVMGCQAQTLLTRYNKNVSFGKATDKSIVRSQSEIHGMFNLL